MEEIEEKNAEEWQREARGHDVLSFRSVRNLGFETSTNPEWKRTFAVNQMKRRSNCRASE
jgi:folate-dependent tRNA-U54 methylase TrmFO/GidA